MSIRPPGTIFHTAQRYSFRNLSMALAMSAIVLIPSVVADTLDVSLVQGQLGAGQSLALLLVNRQPMQVRALKRSERSVVLENGTSDEVVPLVLKDSKIISVGAPIFLEGDGRIAIVPELVTRADRFDVVVRLHVDETRDVPNGKLTEMPTILLSAEGSKPREPLFVPRRAAALDGAYLIFREVPLRSSVLTIRGPHWPAVEVRIASSPGKVVDQDVALIPAAVLAVNWRAAPSPGKAMSCDDRPRDQEPSEVALLSCPSTGRRTADARSPGDQCTTVQHAALPPDKAEGTQTFEQVPAGEYVVSLSSKGLPQVNKLIHLAGGETRSVDVAYDLALVYGHVTRNGKALRAELIFPLTESRTYSAENGEYSLYLASAFPRVAVAVKPCDSSEVFQFVPKTQPVPNQAFDIDLSLNDFTIRVEDADTQAGLPGAQLTISAVDMEAQSSFGTVGAGISDSGGVLDLHSLPADLDLLPCAALKGYRLKCIEPLRLGKEEHRDISIAMQKVTGPQGRVIANGRVSNGLLFWVRANGPVTEQVNVAEDGSFQASTAHSAGEYVVLVSANLPLSVFPMPEQVDGDLNLTVDSLNVRAVRVHLGAVDNRPRRIRLSIGGTAIPGQAFLMHLVRRGHDPRLMPGTDLVIPDIAASGPLSITLGPPYADPY
jgi:hypothetical protein